MYKAFPLRIAIKFLKEKNLLSDDFYKISNDKRNRPIKKGLLIVTLRNNSLFDLFKRDHWPLGNSPEGERKVQFYLNHLGNRTLAEVMASTSDVDDQDMDDEESEEIEDEDSGNGISEAQEFSLKLESHLRDALAKDLAIIESGLKLYQSGERNGIEYSIDNGRIDLLAVDRNGELVVIELKNFRGRNRALGQILYYMGWVEKNITGGKPCRGIIVASEIDDELKIAASRVSGITLCKYTLSIHIDKQHS